MSIKTLALVAAFGSTAFAAANDFSVNFDVDFASKYIWRGANWNNGCVLQPSLAVNYGGFKAQIWGSMDLTNWATWYDFKEKPAGYFTEWDTSVQYTHNFGAFDLTVGGVDYQYPYQGYKRTQEVYGKLGMKGVVDVELGGYFDVKEVEGVYADLTLSKEVCKFWGAPLTLSAKVGYGDKKHNDWYYGYNKEAFADALFTVSAKFDQGKGYTITPYLKYSTFVDEAVAADWPQRDNLTAGVVFGFKF